MQGIIGTGRNLIGRPSQSLSTQLSDSLAMLTEGSRSFSISTFLERRPENRVNDAFLAMGYDVLPTDEYFMDAQALLALKPEGSNILGSEAKSSRLFFESVEDFQSLQIGLTRTNGFMVGLLSRFTCLLYTSDAADE